MTTALPGPAPTPRPLPGNEPLSPEDYRRVVGVVEAVDTAADITRFREQLVKALRSWFGFQGVAVLHGDTAQAALRDGCGVQAGYSRQFLARYADRWITEDPSRDEAVLAQLATLGVVRLRDVADGSRFVEDFLRPSGITDKAAMLIDGGPAGVLYVSLAVHDPRGVPERDLAVLRTLRRHLAPLAADHLTRHRARLIARADWRLTPREWDVADLAARGLSNRQIADRLFIGVDTVKKHLTRVLAETACGSRTQLAALYRAREN